MLQQAITNSLETNEKIENLIKEIEVIKKQVKIMELKDIITEINTYYMGLIIEWRWQRIESVNFETDQ